MVQVQDPIVASQQMKDACADLKSLSEAHALMGGTDQHVMSALALAEQRMTVAAYNYVLAVSSQQPVTQQARRAAHRSPGVGQEQQRPFSRTEPQNSGVALQIPPLNIPVQQPPTTRIPAAGHVITAPGLPDAVIPQGAQMHPRTLARIQAAQGITPGGTPPTTTQGFAQAVVAQAGVNLPGIPPPVQGGDLPDLPMVEPSVPPPFGYPGSPPPTR